MFRHITLELSLKPFRNTGADSVFETATALARQWQPLLRGRESVSVMLWTADGSEILDYRGNADDEIDDDFDFDDFEDYDGEGEIISVTTFKFEQEEDETELVMQVWESGKSEIFAFWQEDDVINISVGGTSSVATYTVRVINGEYVYFRGDTEIERDD